MGSLASQSKGKMVMTKTWAKEDIRVLLEKSPLAVERGLVAVYNNQTFAEKSTEETTILNGVGFSRYDARVGTSLALRIIQSALPGEKPCLDRGGLNLARRIVLKYSGQLAAIANGG